MNKLNSVSQKCKQCLRPIIEDLGYELVDIDYEKKQTGYNLTVYIDGNVPITLDDCEKVHKAIDDPLDNLDPTGNQSYILNVSSCGLDWSFRGERDYKKNIGELVDISLYSKVDNKKTLTATLLSYNEQNIVVKDKKEITLPISSIAKICKHIEF